MAGCGKGKGAPPPPPSGIPPFEQDAETVVVPKPAPPLRPQLSGEIVLAPHLATRVKAGEAVFVSLRRVEQGQSGALIGAARLTTGAWPLSFSLDGSHGEMPTGRMVDGGEVEVSARIDRDGDAVSKQAGDLTGSLRTRLPATKLRLTIDREMR